MARKKFYFFPANFWRSLVEAHTFSLDNRLTDGGMVVRLTRQPPFTPHEDSLYSFLLDADRAQGHSAAGRIR
jgi:hypothetical protein